jgi:hypothetical protein
MVTLNSDMDNYSSHNEISLLLPWYINNTLHGTELDGVENHLKVCLTCRRELIALLKISLAVNQESTYDSAALTSFSQLKNRIHGVEKVEAIPSPVKSALQPTWLAKLKPKPQALDRPKLAMAAAILLALAIPGYINLDQNISNDFRTLSDSETPKPNKNDIRIIFSSGVNKQQIDAIVSEVQGKVIAGPDDQSVYTVRLDNTSSTKVILAKLEQLRKTANVIFAEPAYDLLSAIHSEAKTP